MAEYTLITSLEMNALSSLILSLFGSNKKAGDGLFD